MKCTIPISLFLTAGITLGVWSSAEAASDDKSYPAYGCQATDGIETNFNRSEYRLTRTGTGGSGTVLCPVINDVHECDNFWGNACGGAEVKVKVYDGHLGGNITCTFSARSETGSSTAYDTDTSQLGHDTLTMSVSDWPSGRGAYALSCSMPTNGSQGYTKVFGYFVEEDQ